MTASDVVDLVARARREGWGVEESPGGSVTIDSGDRLTIYREGSDLVMFGSVQYGDDPPYLSDNYPFDLDLAVRFLSGESWAL